ncbi:DNA directed RNA polymerase III subunit RPC3 [Paragonimus skrjabini miyazakii]|uniref:DNA-directed RNA polymerase III subunit RPC3 n=1 Tax=Paragonimus skrjabini miyazakii TaxID=59628 RepID=A0A8S9YWE3_9TREM|nr:DNA directed RNA polymerase III subunit RPC3 [Paragonimus skrjabini miyazakii]
MSTCASQYAQFILQKHFGPTALSATRLMRTKGPVMLLEILRDSPSLCALHITRCLRSLIRHMTVVVRKTTGIKYDLNYPYLFCLPRFPFFSQLVLHFYGEVAEQVMTCLFLMGQATVSDLLGRCMSRNTTCTTDVAERHKFADSLGSTFDTLMKTDVLQIVTPEADKVSTNSETDGTSSAVHARPVCEWPLSKDDVCDILHKLATSGCFTSQAEDVEPPRKRFRDVGEPPAAWKFTVAPNVVTLEAMWRDRLIFRLAEERLGEVCGDILSRLLCIAAAARRSTEITSHESGAVSRSELIRSLRDPVEHFDSYLSLLTEDEMEFLVQEPGLGGHMYTCPYKRVVRQLLIKHAEHVVQVLFQNGGLRIFRLLLSSGPLSHEEIERRVLLPQKDFRRALPRMVAGGLISTTELSRSKEYTSETILCLYSINLPRIANILIELAQHTALRVSLRTEHEFGQKKRLIEQRYRVENLIEKHQLKLSQLTAQLSDASEDESAVSLVSQQKESLEALASSITPSEQQQLDSLTSKLAKLIICEQEAHTTWFIGDLFLRLHSS